MAGKYGTKETKELLNVVKVVALSIVKEVKKDGFQPKDLAAFLKDPAFDAAVKPALEGIGEVVPEVTELDFFDGLDLGKYGYAVMDEILEALKGVVKAK